MTKLKMTTLAAALLSMGLGSGVTLAAKGGDTVVNAPFSRIDADQQSGNNSGTVNANCSEYDGQYDGATASLSIDQSASSSKVDIELEDGRPNTLYTVWVRLKGSAHGVGFGESPITGGGATPLANTADLGQLVADWVGPGSPDQPNGFRTDGKGNGKLQLNLDFPVVGGSYPFNRISVDDLALAQTKNPAATAVPTTIVNPADSAIGGPFMIRMISHCQDDTGHGLSPATREPWFQYP